MNDLRDLCFRATSLVSDDAEEALAVLGDALLERGLCVPPQRGRKKKSGRDRHRAWLFTREFSWRWAWKQLSPNALDVWELERAAQRRNWWDSLKDIWLDDHGISALQEQSPMLQMLPKTPTFFGVNREKDPKRLAGQSITLATMDDLKNFTVGAPIRYGSASGGGRATVTSIDKGFSGIQIMGDKGPIPVIASEYAPPEGVLLNKGAIVDLWRREMAGMEEYYGKLLDRINYDPGEE
jgi:hypothetical protein